MTTNEMKAAFREHAEAFEAAFLEAEASAHAQFDLRDAIGYAEKRINEMAADAMTQVIADLGDKRSNADERTALQQKALQVNGPYLDAAREKAERNRELMVVQAQHSTLQETARLHRKWMDWLIAQEQRAL